ncbi:MAG: hypothetical protein ABMA64_25060 [Myxococcota bacterium]
MIALWLAGCRGDPCGDSCGFDEECQAGVCVVRNCTTSDQCPLGFHCDPLGDCLEGCEVSADCPTVDRCDSDGACVPRDCERTSTDCEYREFCEDGACVDAGEPFCKACTTNEECGEGNLCWADEWCGVDCSGGQECPAGFQCNPIDEDDQSWLVCVAACWMVEPP